MPIASSRRAWALLLAAAAGALVIGAGVIVSGRLAAPPGSPVAWTRFGTDDVHSLEFAPSSTDRLYFGHHGGILESADGGRSWQALPVHADAMGMRAAADGSIVIAGHEVLIASRDGGATWAPVESDLPNIDIHALARDPADPGRMWAYLATGGVYETSDGGTHWEMVLDGHRPFLVAVRGQGSTGLIGVDPFQGLVRSDDGGRTWSLVSRPDAFPVFSMAATPDGAVVLLGTTDGLRRSDDGGASWRSVPFPDPAFAIAVSVDSRTVAVVTQATDFYRSDDGAHTWPGP